MFGKYRTPNNQTSRRIIDSEARQLTEQGRTPIAGTSGCGCLGGAFPPLTSSFPRVGRADGEARLDASAGVGKEVQCEGLAGVSGFSAQGFAAFVRVGYREADTCRTGGRNPVGRVADQEGPPWEKWSALWAAAVHWLSVRVSTSTPTPRTRRTTALASSVASRVSVSGTLTTHRWPSQSRYHSRAS